MASLNETASFSRIAIKWGIIILVGLMVGRFALGIARNIYLAINPPAPEEPTQCFGILPPISFPAADQGNLSFDLQTPTLALPQFPDRAGVYPVILERPNLLALERAVAEADRMEFESQPEQISETTYRWTGQGESPATLQMNVYDGTFVLQRDWFNEPDFLVDKSLISEIEGSDRVKDYLKSPGLMPSDLDGGIYDISYLKASGRSYQPTVSLSEADFVQLDFYRQPIEDLYEVVTSEPDKGVVRAMLSNYPRKAWLVYLEYNYFPVDYETTCTYYLKPINQAWYELQQGQGYVADLDEGVTKAVVRRVDMGYYDSYEKQEFLQPVYVFRGDDNLAAYVPALIDLNPTPTPAPTQ